MISIVSQYQYYQHHYPRSIKMYCLANVYIKRSGQEYARRTISEKYLNSHDHNTMNCINKSLKFWAGY